MKNKKIWLGMLALALIFGMTVVGCGEDDENWVPITQIPYNYLNTTWRLTAEYGPPTITFGLDAGKLSYSMPGGYGNYTTTLSPLSRSNPIAAGFDSGLQGNYGVISFMNNGSKIHYMGRSDWVKR
jgi:hypothetical protein